MSSKIRSKPLIKFCFCKSPPWTSKGPLSLPPSLRPPSLSCPYLASAGGDHSKVSWDAVSPFDLHQVSLHHKLGIDLELLPLPDHQCLLARAKRGEKEARKGGKGSMRKR